MDLLKKNLIDFVVIRYFKQQHKNNFEIVMNELIQIYNSFHFVDSDFNPIFNSHNTDIIHLDISNFLLARIDGMPPLIYV